MRENQKNITWHHGKVAKKDRHQLGGHKSLVLWFTGLSGSGKSTLAVEVEKRLYELGIRTYLLDGDNLRYGLNQNLGFTPEDRKENIRRIGEVAKLFVDAGIVTLAAFISPYQEDRDRIRALVDDKEFIEIYVKCDLEECARRDPKGLYQKVKQGVIKGFTGIDAPYEEPEAPELIIETNQSTVEASAEKIMDYLLKGGLLSNEE
jgi:adenylylsulfate kinase